MSRNNAAIIGFHDVALSSSLQAKTWSKPPVACALGDCTCHPKCYDCPGTYKYVYKSAFQAFQYGNFFLVLARRKKTFAASAPRGTPADLHDDDESAALLHTAINTATS